ncbi:MAG: sporulation initiation factor Spo0A C-terminal domain-containing protein [Clostridia bacterium]|nr:sporulation initiation factor Spo0A C-terminal domain-containing protein [Clostridia bacterium]
MKKELKHSRFAQKPPVIAVFEEREQFSENSLFHGRDAFVGALIEALKPHFRIAPVITSGCDLFPRLFEEIPAVIIVSSTLRDLDAIGLIRSLKSSRHRFDIRFFLCCKTVDNSSKNICRLNDIDGCLSWRDDPVEAAERIWERVSELEETSASRRLEAIRAMLGDDSFFNESGELRLLGTGIFNELLLPLGFKKEHRGTEYLELMIALRVLGTEGSMRMLYACCSECFGVLPSAVERAARYAIECAWNGSSPYMQYKLFGNSVDAERGKPTNAEFVETLARHALDRLRGTEHTRLNYGPNGAKTGE